ncbi:MAG: hypothetical protein LBM77_08820 [Spirochaetaceae bacterium]|nr:hypothetical protein [Spirochaetaceae bacterium]
MSRSNHNGDDSRTTIHRRVKAEYRGKSRMRKIQQLKAVQRQVDIEDSSVVFDTKKEHASDLWSWE